MHAIPMRTLRTVTVDRTCLSRYRVCVFVDESISLPLCAMLAMGLTAALTGLSVVLPHSDSYRTRERHIRHARTRGAC